MISMKQALLTENDIRKFIDDAINGNRTMTTQELMSYLDVSRAMIHWYIDKGMPFEKKGNNNIFKLTEVKDWMRKNLVGQKI